MKTIKTVLIDPENRTITSKTIEGYSKDTFKWLYPVLDCSLVEIVQLDSSMRMVIDEEGLLKPNFFFHFGGIPGIPHLAGNPFAGKAILMIETSDGYLRGLTGKELNAALMAASRLVRFVGDDDAADEAMKSGALRRPAQTVSAMNDKLEPVGEPTVTWEWSPNTPPERLN